MRQQIVLYFSVLPGEISRFIKQKQSSRHGLHEGGADNAAKAREGLGEVIKVPGRYLIVMK